MDAPRDPLLTPEPPPEDGFPEHGRWMTLALELARKAGDEGEVPVGAVVVEGGRPIGVGWNRTEALDDPTAHAEILALRRASATCGNHRLVAVTLYTTLEPCPMCLGAILESRVARLVVGASDPKRGAISLWKSGAFARYPFPGFELLEGVKERGCRACLQDWFQARRSSSGG